MSSKYRVGVYGTRNVCTQVANNKYSVASFVSDMSTGFSGNMGFKIPSNWAYDQFNEISLNPDWGIDKVGYSGKFPPVSKLDAVYQKPAKPSKADLEKHLSIFTMIDKIKELEQAYDDFYTPLYKSAPQTMPYLSATKLATSITNFLRRYKYEYDSSSKNGNSLEWFVSTGYAIDDSFVDYVKKNHLSLYNYFEKYIKGDDDSTNLYDGYNGLIDLAHLAATLECYITTSPVHDFWTGWGGDIATGMADTNRKYESKAFKTIQEASDATVGAVSDSSCNFVDLCCDSDAIKLADMIKNATSDKFSLSTAMKDYYTNYVKNRYSQKPPMTFS